MDRRDMAQHRALERQAERSNPFGELAGRGQVPSMGLSQVRGGKAKAAKSGVPKDVSKASRALMGDLDDARSQGQHLVHHIIKLHGSGYAEAFSEGMKGGFRTGAYEGMGRYREGMGTGAGTGGMVGGGGDDYAGLAGSAKRPSKAAMMRDLARIKKENPGSAGEVARHLRELRGGMTGAGVLSDVWEYIQKMLGMKKSSAPSAPSHSAPSAPSEPARKYESDDTRDPAERLRADYGIGSKKEFQKWSLKNHPDKGGDTNEYGRVSGLASRAGYTGGKRVKRVVGAGDGRRQRGAIVSKVMREKGFKSLAEASKYVKEHNLY